MTLDEKQQKLQGIGTAIQVAAPLRTLTMTERAKVEELQYRMEFRAKELLKEMAEREVDMKLDIMQQVLDVVKGPQHIIT